MKVKLTVTDTSHTGFLPDMGVIDAVKVEDENGVRYHVIADGNSRYLREEQVQLEN